MSGRNSGLVTRKAARAANSPFSVIPPKIDPPSRGPLPLALTATAMSTGTSARITSSATLRRRRNIIPSSERRNLAGDIEALPGEVHELLLQARAFDAEAADTDTGPDERSDDRLRRPVPRRRGDPPVSNPDVGQTVRAEDAGRLVEVGGVDAHP